MRTLFSCVALNTVTLPTERVSWNCTQFLFLRRCHLSRSPRSVWVEITYSCSQRASKSVTLPTERVSWNFIFHFCGAICCVTLPTERVSWNVHFKIPLFFWDGHAPHGACELKCIFKPKCDRFNMSRSPRSVWVEILYFIFAVRYVASRSPRSVWVEISDVFVVDFCVVSRSPRSVWVEMNWTNMIFSICIVTLPTERVSWNAFVLVPPR